MWGIFKKRSELSILEKRYADLLKQAHELSTRDRKASDLKTAEAEEVRVKMEAMRAAEDETSVDRSR